MTKTPKPVEKCPYCFHESANHNCIGWTIRDYTPTVGVYICCQCKMGFEGKQTFTLPNDEEGQKDEMAMEKEEETAT